MRFLLNFITNTKVKSTFIILILLCIFIFISALSYTNAISSNIADSVFRLHVIANSDSAEDQELKYKVRDALLQYMDSLCSNSNSKSEIVEISWINPSFSERSWLPERPGRCLFSDGTRTDPDGRRYTDRQSGSALPERRSAAATDGSDR